MPNTRAAAKGLRQSNRRAQRNARAKAALEVAVRKFRTAVARKDRGVATEAYRTVVKLADRTAGKGVIPKNRAARIKSRLAVTLSAVAAS